MKRVMHTGKVFFFLLLLNTHDQHKELCFHEVCYQKAGLDEPGLRSSLL